MKISRIVLFVLIAFLFSAKANAQVNAEKGIIVKIVKNINGQKTVIDTVFENETDAQKFLATQGQNDIDQKIEMIINKDIQKNVDDKSQLKWIVKANGDSALLKEIIVMSEDSIIKTGKGQKKFIFITDDGQESVINIDSLNGDENNQIVVIKQITNKNSNEDALAIKNVKNKKIEIIFSDDDFSNDDNNQNIEIKDNEEINNISTNKDAEKTVWVYKNNSHKVIIFVSSFDEADFTKNEINSLKQNNIKFDKSKVLNLENFTIQYSDNDKFILSFRSKKKSDLTVRIVDTKGNEIFIDQMRKFKGDYSHEINFPKNEKNFVIQIVEGKNTFERKIYLERR